jgi:hypothetical protein
MEKKDYGFINGTLLIFDDISSEVNREYTFPNGSKLFIEHPLVLNVSKSGGHRLYAADGTSYYVQPKEGWYIKWVTGEKQPNFVK